MNIQLDLSALDKAFGGLKLPIDGGEEKSKFHRLRIGFHTGKDNYSGLIEPLSIDNAVLSKYFENTAAQIFTQVPQTTVFVKMESPEKIVEFLKKSNMKLVIHTPYAMNDFWKKTHGDGTPDINKLSLSLENAEKFMYDGYKYPAEDLKDHDSSETLLHQLAGLVVHLPKAPPEQVVHVLKARNFDNVTILLENHAYKPDEGSYETPAKLNKLTELLIKANVPNWGYCIDTAHLFVQISRADRDAGYKIETRAGMERWLSELTSETRSRIKCWHLNGSMNPASSYDDKHAIPVFGLNHLKEPVPNPTGKARAKELEVGYCKDYMWGNLLMRDEIKHDGLDANLNDQIEALSDSSLIPVLQHSMTHNIPIILEINRGNDDDVTACLKMFNKLENGILKKEFD